MRHYCTLFDSKYLTKGLVLYESLKKHSSAPFRLHVLALDADCWRALKLLRLPKMDLMPIESFVHEMHLAEVRDNRTHQEWCWTLASQFSEYLLRGLDAITYLDADMMFFANPDAIFSEIGDCSIAVIPHRFIPSKKHLEVNGQFNVSWVTFRDTPVGRECLSTWAWQCRERCSAAIGCGDQAYLDAWPGKYGPELAVIRNSGAGVAPWNLANYTLTEGPKVDDIPVVFFHAHEFEEQAGGTFRLTNYELRPEDVALIYHPYMSAYQSAKERIGSVQIHG